MAPDTLGHFFITGGGRGNQDDLFVALLHKLPGIAAFAGTHTAENQMFHQPEERIRKSDR